MSNYQLEHDDNDKPHVEVKSEKIVGEEMNQPPVIGKAADDIDDHTPSNPDPVKSDVDPSDGREKLKPLYEMVERLAGNVDTLANVVSSMVKDEKVNKSVPWTHRGGR